MLREDDNEVDYNPQASRKLRNLSLHFSEFIV
jgi:hypothetical protein